MYFLSRNALHVSLNWTVWSCDEEMLQVYMYRFLLSVPFRFYGFQSSSE